MTIYIASSWKHEHCVRMLTALLRRRGYEVNSFVEHNYGERKAIKDGLPEGMTFDKWVLSDRGKDAFRYDTQGATTADLVIYIGPSGTDAWAEVGVAWAEKVPVVGLYAKGEQSGLMRRMMVKWYNNHNELLNEIMDLAK